MSVAEFPPQPRRRLSIKEIEMIGFQTHDNRDCFIVDPDDIMRIMKFIVAEKIVLVPAYKE